MRARLVVRFVSLSVLGATLVAGVTKVGMAETGATTSIAGRAEVALARLALVACTTHCEYCAGSANNHNNVQQQQNPNDDQGEEHTCAVSPNGCADHTCNQTDTNELRDLLPYLSGDQLVDLASRFTRLHINDQRRAIQLFGCDEKVILSVNLTPAQLDHFVLR